MIFQKFFENFEMFFKVLNSTLRHNNFSYQLGLNIDSKLFNDKECQNGLHFSSLEHLPLWLKYGDKLAFISIPVDSRVIHFKNKSKADKIFINEIINLEDWKMWENEEFCMRAIEDYWWALEYIKNQTEEMCIKAVKKDGYVLKYVQNQTETVVLEGMKQNGIALKYVRNQTEAICLQAVKQNGMALQHVINQTPEICLEAIKQNPEASKYVKV